jgi:DNA-binding transcriptional LysR family regulator/molybdenum cofactor biosynthesis enzyme MoaA
MKDIYSIDLNLYKIFLAVAKNKSISGAAKELYVSQPAISYSIKTLENELNCKLFIRTSFGVELTPEAEKLLYYIETAYNTISVGQTMLGETGELVSGNIRIGVPTHIGVFFVNEMIKKFNDKYPGIKFSIVNKSTNEMVNMLEIGKLDLIIDSYPIASERNDITIFELMEIDNCFAVGEKYKNLASREVKLDELKKYSLLLQSKSTSTRKILDECTSKYGVEFNSLIEVSTTEVMEDLVGKGLGIGYFAVPSIMNHVNEKKLYKLQCDVELPKTKIAAAYVEELLLSAPKEFIKFMKETLARKNTTSKKELRIILTQDCTYKCEFCHKEGIKCNIDTKLNNDDIVFLHKIFKDNFGINSIHFTGGEPLLKKDFIELLKDLKANDAYICITTNGYLLDKQIDIGKYVDKVNISLHTLDKKVYENTSNLSLSFDKTIKNIRLLRSSYPLLNIGINMTWINNLNSSISDIKNIINFVESIKGSLKIIELYPNTLPNYISLTQMGNYMEKLGFKFIEQSFRKTRYSNSIVDVYLTKCTCTAALESNNAAKTCNENNDLYISMDGKIRLCIQSSDEMDICEEIKERDNNSLIEKINEALNNLGSHCLNDK